LSPRSENTSVKRRPVASWALAGFSLILAIGSGLLLTQLLLSPSSDELLTLAAYLTLASAVSLGLGWISLRVADRVLGLSLRARAFASNALAGGVALLNVVIVAQLMFLSTEHDLKLLVAFVVFSALVTAFFSMWAAAAVAGRLEQIAAAVKRLAGGDFATSLSVAGGDEVAQLARDVNALADRLRAAEEQRTALENERRELTAAVSHDLRTPLASLRAMAEALGDGVVDEPSEVNRYYATMRREIERLSRLIDDLFELAQLDAGALRLEKRPIRVQEIAAEVIDGMQAAARLAGVEMTLSVAGSPPELPLDGARVERAVSNLVRNALEHTPAGGRVAVRVAASEDSVSVTVTDTGEGIDHQDLPHVWTRFYRAEKSRRRSVRNGTGDGAGLGLAIVRGIVEAHGGSVQARSETGEGATFRLELPMA
jgi:signal transduction histidine kinase